MSYDTIIIGAGLSGLASGIRLAYYDKRVCILERHTTVGGLNSFYRLRGRNHDVGLHAVTNVAPRGTPGPLNKLLRQLRLTWEDFDLRPQLGSRISFPGCALRFTNDFEVFQQQVAERFPREMDGFRRLVSKVKEFDLSQLDREPISARAVVAEHISDPLLVDMLFCPLMFYGSATPRDMDFGQFAIMFRSILLEGLGRPAEGVRRLIRLLVRSYKSLGGQLRLRAGVKSIRIVDGRAVAVVLDSGEEVEAKQILSSAGSVETLRLCDDAPPKHTIERPGELSFVETIFSLDCQPAELGYHDTAVFYSNTPDFHYECPQEPVDLRGGIICSPNNFDYVDHIEEGRIRITALAEPDHWMRLPEDDYVAQKSYWCERVIESSLSHLPDFRKHIVDTDVFTPRTIRRFTGHINGAVYGAPHKHLDGCTPYQNLFLCGTDQGFLGIIGSMISGISMVNKHLLRD